MSSVFLKYSCTVSFVNGDTMAVEVPGEAAVSRLRSEESLGIQIGFDETTYKLMFSAVDRVMSAKDDRLAHLREVLLGQLPFEKRLLQKQSFSWLNPSQQDAVNEIRAEF